MALAAFRSEQRIPGLLLGMTRTILAATVFLIPLFFIPGLSDPVELPKAALFLFLILAAAVTYTGYWVAKGEVRLRRVPGMWLLILFVVLVVLSSIFSVHRVQSLLGTVGYVHHTLPLLIAFVILVVLINQVLENERDTVFFAVLLTISLGITALIGFLQFAGASPFPWTELRSPSFVVAGSASATFAVLMGALVSLGIALFGFVRGFVWRLLGTAAIVIPLVLLLAIDEAAGWIAALVSVVVTIVFGSLRRITRLELLLATIAIIIALIGLFLPTSSWLGNRVTSDLRLDTASSWNVTKAAFVEYPILGSGPTTFFNDFVRFRPASFNDPLLRNLRFVKASDEAMQLLVTLGALGVLSLIALIAHVLVAFTRRSESLSKQLRETWFPLSAVLGVVAGTIASFFFVPSTFSTFAVFWITLGLLLVLVRRSDSWKTSTKPFARLVGTLSFFLSMIALIITTAWSVRLLLADRGVGEATAAIQRTEELDTVVNRLSRVIRLNPTNAIPYIIRSQTQLVNAQVLVQSGSTDSTKIQNLLSGSLADADTATRREPNNPAVLEAVADLYKNIGQLTGNTGSLVISTLERAVSVEPNNAGLHVDLGQAYYLVASATAQQGKPDDPAVQDAITKARTSLDTALRLRQSDIDAQFGLILIDEFSGKKDEAFAQLVSLAQANPSSAVLQYELGLRYSTREDPQKAKEAFTAAVQLEPSFAQAHWQLGLIAEQQKDTESARREFELVRDLDPTNTDAVKKLEELTAKP